jgi:hypothetical protein
VWCERSGIWRGLLQATGLVYSPLRNVCGHQIDIPFSSVDNSKSLVVNRKTVFANKCAGGTCSSLHMLFSILDLPLPVSKNVYTMYVEEIEIKAKLQAGESMKQARHEVWSWYGAEDDSSTVDILVSCDGTWQCRGFSSFFGAVFVIAHETGKVIDYIVKSKFCKACKHWEAQDHTTDEYKAWKESHTPVCSTNFSGSAGSRNLRERLRFSSHLCLMVSATNGSSQTATLRHMHSSYESSPMGKTTSWRRWIVSGMSRNGWEQPYET